MRRVRKAVRRVWRKLSALSLRSKMTLFHILLIALPVLAISIFTVTAYVGYIRDQLTTAKLQALQQISSGLDSYVEELGNLTRPLNVQSQYREILEPQTDTSRRYDHSREVSDYFLDILSSRSEILGVYLFCENGAHYKLGLGVQRETLGGFQEQAWYRAARDNLGQGMLFASNLLEEQVAFDRPAFCYLKGIIDPVTREYLGAELLVIDLDRLGEILAPYLVDQPGRILLTDSSGRVLYHPDPSYVDQLITDRFFHTAVLGKDSGFYQHKSPQQQMGIFHVTCATSKLKVIELTPLHVFYRPVLNLYLSTGVLLSVFMGFLLAATAVFSQKITQPLRDLSRAVSLFSRNLEFSVKAKSRDEIGQLTRSFSCMTRRIQALIRRVYSARLGQKEAELNALQSKVNPHFIYNTLEMLGNMADETGRSDISVASRNLGRILHYSLKFENQLAEIRTELEYVRYYLSIQQMRFPGRMEVIFDMMPDVLEYRIPKLLLQPLVENAVAHGLEATTGLFVLLLSGERTTDGIRLHVVDNGAGIDDETLALIHESLRSGVNLLAQEPGSNRGFALLNIHTRLQLHYGAGSGLEIGTRPSGGAEVTLVIHDPATKGE